MKNKQIRDLTIENEKKKKKKKKNRSLNIVFKFCFDEFVVWGI